MSKCTLWNTWSTRYLRVGEPVMCGSAMWWGPTPTPLLPSSHPNLIYCDIRAMPIKYEQVIIFLWYFLLQPLEQIRRIGKTICWSEKMSFILIIRVTVLLVYGYPLEEYESICRCDVFMPKLFTHCITRYDPLWVSLGPFPWHLLLVAFWNVKTNVF